MIKSFESFINEADGRPSAKVKETSISITFPIFCPVYDYHEFDEFPLFMKRLGVTGVKILQLEASDFSDFDARESTSMAYDMVTKKYDYLSILYVGTKPTKDELVALAYKR